MSENKYFKVMVTNEYVVQANSQKEAMQIYKWFSNWHEEDSNCYELSLDDLKKYGITNENDQV